MNDPYAWTTDAPQPSGGDVLTLVAPAAEPAASEPIVAESPSSAMARLLELAARNADELVAEATAEAERLTSEATAEAAELTAAARAEADQLLAEARGEAERMRADTDERRQAESEHRDSVRAHLNDLLERLEATPVA